MTILPSQYRQIRAVYDAETIRIYQAFSCNIANSACNAQRFVSPPFSMSRMTWIKPSFLWMMYRCDWGRKDENQRRILAVDITRTGFEWALSHSCSTSFRESREPTHQEWQKKMKSTCVRTQWDPERDIYLNPLPIRSLQIGLRGEAVFRYVNDWIVRIIDVTAFAQNIYDQVSSGNKSAATRILPKERIYELNSSINNCL